LDTNTSPKPSKPTLIAGLPWLSNRFVIAALVLVAAAVLIPVGVWASSNHPDGLNRSRVERRIAEIYGRPDDAADDKVVGDILIERFYAVDAETGQRYIADVVKGRVTGIQNWTNEFGTTFYTLVLERQTLQNQRQILRGFVTKQAPAPLDSSIAYLGLVVQPGTEDAMAVNFDGTLPVGREGFYVWNRKPMYETLLNVGVTSLGAPQLMPSKGYNFLLSTTELWPYFKTAFNVNKAVWVSEQILVDATSPEGRLAFYQRLTGS
jgi:hypothetical protein